MFKYIFTGFVVIWFGVSGVALANDIRAAPQEHDADRQALREMLHQVERAINEKKFDELAGFLDPQANVIFENAEVADGAGAVTTFYRSLFEGDSAVLRDMKTKVEVNKPAEFYGNTAVAYGTAEDSLTTLAGETFTLSSVWAVTVVKEGSVWKVVSLQFTSNVFSNPILDFASSKARVNGFVGLVLGLLVSWVLIGSAVRLRKKGKK